MSQAADDLAIDLMWFFESQLWEPALNVDQGLLLAATQIKLGCALTFILDEKNTDSTLIVTWQTAVRALMKDLGFYRGHFKSPDKKYFLRKIAEEKLSFAEPKGQAAYVFVTVKNPGSDKARCAFANEARARSAKHAGGILIEIKSEEGLPNLWASLRRTLRNRRVCTIQFFDHGAVERQWVGGDALTADTPIPNDVGARFASGAVITLYGCTTMFEARAGRNLLASNLASHLLVRGGSVVGFKAFVDLDVAKLRVREPPKENRVERQFSACKGSDVMEDIFRLMRSLKGNHTVKYSQVGRGTDKNVEQADLLQYPAEYPNIGYYA